MKFEHPLNEKFRAYLRYEALLTQLDACQGLSAPYQHIAFFKALLELTELLERCDIRSDLLKDLGAHAKQLSVWADYPEVNTDTVHDLQRQVDEAMTHLPRLMQLAQALKNDRLLSAIRQRFSVPAGLCSFDSPLLHHWLQQSELNQTESVRKWLGPLTPFRKALTLTLHLHRGQHEQSHCIARKGFYQAATENYGLLQLRLQGEPRLYPTVSGNQHRFTIRFLPWDDKDKVGDVEFTLLCC